MQSRKSVIMRTVDIARRSGYSVQQIRNLERDGVLPPAARTAAGYRMYGEIHLYSARTYRALAVGAGPADARQIVRAVHELPASDPLALLDTAHARLDAERADLAQAEQAARAIAGEPIADIQPTDSMTVSELAGALGIRSSTLRHWEAQGLIAADRDPTRGSRIYTPVQVRDARIVHQLRRAGYRIDPLRTLMPRLRRTGRSTEITAGLAARRTSIEARSRALLEAAISLHALFALVEAASLVPTTLP